MIKTPKKLIEVALPLDDINVAASREKSIRHGHPSTLHLWWARRPLAAARAVIFAQMVNDPGYQQGGGFRYGIKKEHAAIEREKLFDIIRDLVKWENTDNEEVLSRAREAISKSWSETCEMNKNHAQAAELFDPNRLPPFHDPFAGGGTIPLEAQRLGLESYASDLNPVAVMINKAMIEIPPKFSGLNPIGPIPEEEKQKKLIAEWPGAAGLAEDVRRYGVWIRQEAERRIGHLYPDVEITPEMAAGRPDLKKYVGKKLKILAWLWARTVKSPNPAYRNSFVPLSASFVLATKKGKEAWIEPLTDGADYRFVVKSRGAVPESAKKGTKEGRGANFRCILSETPIPSDYIRDEIREKRSSQRLMAIVAEGNRERVYLDPTDEMQSVALSAKPEWIPELEMNQDSKDLVSGRGYGITNWSEIFTDRQLVALDTFTSLVAEVAHVVENDAVANGFQDDGVPLRNGGQGAAAYAQAVCVYLGLAASKFADNNSVACSWMSGIKYEVIRNTFSRQALPMTWDYAEPNPFAGSSGDYFQQVTRTALVLDISIPSPPTGRAGHADQRDAAKIEYKSDKIFSIDPPYYDNIAYADLSDYFYIWLRKALKDVYPELLATMVTPKSEELVALSYRHQDKLHAEKFFLTGMREAMRKIADSAHEAFPVTIYYAFKQSETKDAGTSSTGWETFLSAVVESGFSITGTWPVRTERAARTVSIGTNTLASSIILVCRQRKTSADSVSRRQFQRELRDEMPVAIEAMIGGSQGVSPVAPVDLAQAAIGPGMGVFSKYAAVLNQDGSRMAVHDALILINHAITDYLNPESGSFDADTLFCDSWFAEYGWSTGEFGQANVLAQGKGTTVDGVRDAGVIESGSGKVRLLRWREYPAEWDPKRDDRTPVWEALHQLIRALNQEGESGAGELLAGMPERGESIRQLAYHLYTLCERKKWAEDARAYNELIASWHAIVAASHEVGHTGTQVQLELDT